MDFFAKLFAKIGSLFLPAVIILAPSPSASSGLISPSPSYNPSPIPSYSPSPSPTPKPTPKPSPSPSPSPVTAQQLDDWFTSFSNHFSIDRSKLWTVAVCESGLNPNARNGDYAGLFQFSSGTWRSTRAAMNLDGNPQLRFNPQEAIKTAAFKISTVGLSAWPNCVK